MNEERITFIPDNAIRILTLGLDNNRETPRIITIAQTE